MEDLDILLEDFDFDLIDRIEILESRRFSKVSNEDLDNFLQEQQNQNTRRKTFSDVKLLKAFLAEEGEFREIKNIPPNKLDEYLSRFIVSVRKRDSSEFEPSSLRNFLSSFERHLKSKKYGHSIIADLAFERTRSSLKAKQKNVKSQGKGNKPKAADEITDEEITMIYEAGNLGLKSRVSQLNSMWMMCTLNFGMRTGNEVHNMRWGDVELRSDLNNGESHEYIILSAERQSKTRTGENPRDVRKKPRAYAIPNQPDRDPVACYIKYRKTRPSDMLEPESPFFLSINYRGKEGMPWYKSMPMGINKLSGIMNEMKKGTNIADDKHLTPYSMRKHLVQKLTDEGVSTNQIMEISGHKNPASIGNYSYLKPEQQRKLSVMLSTGNSAAPHPSATVATPPDQLAIRQSDCTQQPLSGNVNITANSLAQQRFLTSILSGNTINGNVNICLSPETFGFTSTNSEGQSSSKIPRLL